jgi:hypothetical protein
MATKTAPSLYTNDNGMICCVNHGGSYFQSEYQHAPEQFTYRTPIESWEQVDDEFIALWTAEMGSAPKCEMCR